EATVQVVGGDEKDIQLLLGFIGVGAGDTRKKRHNRKTGDAQHDGLLEANSNRRHGTAAPRGSRAFSWYSEREGGSSRCWSLLLLWAYFSIAWMPRRAVMKRKQLYVNNEVEALVAEQALLLVRELQRTCRRAPRGQVLDQAEGVVVTKGRDLLRLALQASL